MPDPTPREIHPGIFVVHLPLPMRPTIVNVTLLHSNDEWALIDTGINTQDSLDTLGAALALVGCSFDKLDKIISTHHHPDHYGASQALRERGAATIHLHQREHAASQHWGPGALGEETVKFFEQHGIPMQRFGYIPSPGEFWRQLYAPAVPDGFIDDGDVIRVGSFELEVVTTPGHTPGHCVFYLRREKVMIAGDHLLPKITPHVGLYPGGPENPLADFIDSQRKVQSYNVALVLPAHGGVFSDHRRRAEQIIQHHHYRLQEMLDIVKRQPHTAYEVASLAWSFGIDASLAMQIPATFEAIAHLEYMRALGTVVREDTDVTRYRAG